MINYRKPFRAIIDKSDRVYCDFEFKSLAISWAKMVLAKSGGTAEVVNTITNERWTV